ncbi:MAG: translation initiation factor IF-2 subunit beta [Candidatus Diapherotrites archaeon]
MEYEKMLDRAYALLPKEALAKERFEMPRVEAFIQGNKTIIRNFGQIVKALNREERHIIKFITNETAAPATLSDGKVTINSKFSQQQVVKLFDNYLNQYVLCHECGKPDTRFIEQHGVKVLKCDACGATKPVKRL